MEQIFTVPSQGRIRQRFAEQNIKVFKVYARVRVLQRFVEQNVKLGKVHAHDIVQQRFVEQNMTIMTVFSRDGVQQLLLARADHLGFLPQPSSSAFGGAHHLGQHGFLPGQSSTAFCGAGLFGGGRGAGPDGVTVIFFQSLSPLACGPPAQRGMRILGVVVRRVTVPQIQDQIVDQDEVAAQVADVPVIMQLVFQQFCHT